MTSSCASPIENKEGHVRGEEVAKDMTSVQALLTKHVIHIHYHFYTI